jgi:hypothetical protein
MATKKVLVNLDFSGNQAINIRAEVAASEPSTASPGRFYYNSTYEKLYVYTALHGWQVVGQDLPANIVTGTGLTADKVVLGNGGSGVKISSYEIHKTVPAGAEFTDYQVRQSPATSSAAELPILFSTKPYMGDLTDSVLLDQYFTYNPNNGTLSMKNLMVHGTIETDTGEVALVNYVDAQDQKLADRISSISGFGRYLSGWDMEDGEPTSLPTTATYTLKTGDYFVISNVPSSGTKYKPNQTGTWTVSQPFAHTTTSEDCVVGGYWKYDGSTWSYFAPEQVVSLPAFTNSVLGAIKGNQSPGYVYHDPSTGDGYGKVYGWDNKADTSTSHTITIEGDATGNGSHKNGTTDGNATISITIGNNKITTAKIADGNVTTAKIANNAVDNTKIKAKSTLVAIMGSQSSTNPYWQSTGNGGEYKAIITGVTMNGTVRLCEYGSSTAACKEVDCFYEYATDSSGVASCTAYINASAAPASNVYCFLCRKE